MKNICVLGLGYIGLPTAAMFATHGFQVVGVDVNRRVVDTLNNGEVYIHEPGLKTLVQRALKSDNLRVACEPEPADVFIIAVPTPVLKVESSRLQVESTAENIQPSTSNSRPRPKADLSYVIAAAESIVSHLRPENLVILESTVPPRTTVDFLLPILEKSGLKAGSQTLNVQPETRDFYVAHCPERVLPSRILEELVRNDRVIGGVDRASAEMAKALYASFVEGEIFLTDATTAEMVKLMENTYRDVNIALANEFALVAEQVGISVWEAIELANRHPRVNILNSGPGVGGHCIAVDPWFIVQTAPGATPLIQAARRVNDGMPAHVVGLVKRAVAGVNKPVIACLGLAYKGGVDDIRESPAVEVVQLLQAEGLEVRAFDPYVSQAPGLGGVLVTSLEKAIEGADCVVILTDHDPFRQLDSQELAGPQGRFVIDTRNCLKADNESARSAMVHNRTKHYGDA